MPVTHAMGVAQSGMNAATRRLNVTANNVANLNTDGFAAGTTVNQDVRDGGVISSVAPLQTEAPVILRDNELVSASNTDLVRETVNRIEAVNAYKANAAVFKAADEVAQTLFETV